MNAIEPETITIVEGPPPDFKQVPDVWPLGVLDDPQPSLSAYVQMRTFNGPKMLERCQRAWREDRPVKLDFPDGTGMRRQINIVAVRWSEVEEGHLLHLWVQLPPDAVEALDEDADADETLD
jgi:hypothetical protein